MSYRPTISVYLEGNIIDIGYYRNWSDKYLFYEAMAIAAFLGDCRTREEYLSRRYGAGDIAYSVSPEVFDSSEDSLKELEECSEMPVLVDLTSRCIYTATHTLPEEELQNRPSILDDLPSYGYREKWEWIPEDSLPPETAEGDDEDLLGTDWLHHWEKKREPVTDLRSVSTRSDFYTMLDNCRIPYGGLDMKEIRNCYLDWTDNGERGLSEDMLHVIRKRIERNGGETESCESARKTIQYRR